MTFESYYRSYGFFDHDDRADTLVALIRRASNRGRVPFLDLVDAVKAALVGEYEPLRAFEIRLSEKDFSGVTEQERFVLRDDRIRTELWNAYR